MHDLRYFIYKVFFSSQDACSCIVVYNSYWSIPVGLIIQIEEVHGVKIKMYRIMSGFLLPYYMYMNKGWYIVC